MQLGGDAVIGGNIALWRAIGGVWRAVREPDGHDFYSIALPIKP